MKNIRLTSIFTFLCFLLNGQLLTQEPGDLDLTFGDDGITSWNELAFQDNPFTMSIQQDDKIIVAGESNISDLHDMVVLRLNPEGGLDNSFGVQGVKLIERVGYDYAFASCVQNDGKILVAGASGMNGIICRLLSNGEFDNTFGSQGVKVFESSVISGIYEILVLEDNSILIAGDLFNTENESFQACIVKLNSYGLVDNSFGNDGIAATDVNDGSVYFYDLILKEDGKLLAGGEVNYFDSDDVDIAFYQFLGDGSIDEDFVENGHSYIGSSGKQESMFDMVQLENGKFLFCGYEKTGTDYLQFVARIQSDGYLDDSFGGDGMINYMEGILRSISLQDDGKPITVGSKNDEFCMLRLNEDGTPDVNFGDAGVVLMSLNTYNYMMAVDFQSNYKIIATGYSGDGDQSDINVMRFESGLYADVDEFELKWNESLRVSPNPIKSSHFKINISQLESQNCEIAIFSTTGKLEYKKSVTLVNGAAYIELPPMSDGLYLLRLNDRQYTYAAKIIINR